VRKRIEEANGWIKEVGGMVQTKLRGVKRVESRLHQQLWEVRKNIENYLQDRKSEPDTRDFRF
jgi:hypothetical protein